MDGESSAFGRKQECCCTGGETRFGDAAINVCVCVMFRQGG